ncbi:response regulator [Caballeronia sp. LZ043]|nr:response regulator [Caballeronia sp. LZ033]MDR5824931.1 response regulator [Caballeronia sp. LZ043]
MFLCSSGQSPEESTEKAYPIRMNALSTRNRKTAVLVEPSSIQISSQRGNDVDSVLEPVIHVVEDDISFRRALTRMLSCSGYVVRNYGSAGEFLVSASDSKAGCILLDLELGGPDGLEVQQAILRQHHALPIVFMSAYSDVPRTVRAMKSGAIDFLLKPFDRQTLLDAIQTALGTHGTVPAQAASVDKPALLDREQSVLNGILKGKRNKEIAAELKLSERTIKSSRASLMRQFGATSLVELVRRAEGA